LLESLVDQSLLKRVEGVGGEPRFVILETIREYALERLAECGEADAIRQQHAMYFLELVEQAQQWIRYMRPEREPWLERLAVEYDNLRAALEWFSERGEAEHDLRLAGALGLFWQLRFHWRQGRARLEAALVRSGNISEAARAKALAAAAHLTRSIGDLTTARICRGGSGAFPCSARQSSHRVRTLFARANNTKYGRVCDGARVRAREPGVLQRDE
jgi:predicted ATPase